MPVRVDVTGDHVAADAVAELQRALEVDRARRRSRRAERGAVQRLGHHVGREARRRSTDGDREAGTVDGDALPDLESRERRARRDLDPPGRAAPGRRRGSRRSR